VNVPDTAHVEGGTHGNNDVGQLGYVGPCPPRGASPHTYRFFLYALSGSLDLQVGATKTSVLDALGGKVLAQTLLTGTYSR
jgi:phosphatidylethanolamine-binding protein (PEBP) family uncharacterized protein